MLCTGGQTLYLQYGYWAPSADSSPDEVQECLPKHCTGSFTLQSTEPLLLSFSLDPVPSPSSCWPGYRGFKCTLCQTGYAPGKNGACDLCPVGIGSYGTLFSSVGTVVGATLGLGAGLYLAALAAFYLLKVRVGDGGKDIPLPELAALLLRRSVSLVLFLLLASQAAAGMFSAAAARVQNTGLEPYYASLSQLQLRGLDVSMQCFEYPFFVLEAAAVLIAALYALQAALLLAARLILQGSCSCGACARACCRQPQRSAQEQANDLGIALSYGFWLLQVAYGALTQVALDYLSCTQRAPMTFYTYAVSGGDGTSLPSVPGMPSVGDILRAADPWNSSFGAARNFTLLNDIHDGSGGQPVGVSVLLRHPTQVCGEGDHRSVYAVSWAVFVFFSVGYPLASLLLLAQRQGAGGAAAGSGSGDDDDDGSDGSGAPAFRHSTRMLLHGALADRTLRPERAFFMPLHLLSVLSTLVALNLNDIYGSGALRGAASGAVSVAANSFIIALSAASGCAIKLLIKPFDEEQQWQNSSFMAFNVLTLVTAGCNLVQVQGSNLVLGLVPLGTLVALLLFVVYKWGASIVKYSLGQSKHGNKGRRVLVREVELHRLRGRSAMNKHPWVVTAAAASSSDGGDTAAQLPGACTDAAAVEAGVGGRRLQAEAQAGREALRLNFPPPPQRRMNPLYQHRDVVPSLRALAAQAQEEAGAGGYQRWGEAEESGGGGSSGSSSEDPWGEPQQPQQQGERGAAAPAAAAPSTAEDAWEGEAAAGAGEGAGVPWGARGAWASGSPRQLPPPGQAASLRARAPSPPAQQRGEVFLVPALAALVRGYLPPGVPATVQAPAVGGGGAGAPACVSPAAAEKPRPVGGRRGRATAMGGMFDS